MRELETPRLGIRPYESADLDAMAAMYADPEVTALTKLGRRSRAEAEAILAGYVGGWRERGYGMRALFLRPDGAYIGECGFFTHPTTGEAALRYALAKPYWGRGLMAEALRAVIGDGFRAAGLERIVSIVQAENAASLRLMEKVGMRVERTAREGETDLLVYAMSRGEWRPAS